MTSPETTKAGSSAGVPGAASAAVNSGDWSVAASGLIPGRDTLGPLFLMTATPCFSIVFYHVCREQEGNFLAFARICWEHGFFTTLHEIWPSPWNVTAWQLIVGFIGLEMILQKYLPGKIFHATMTPKGNVPVYTANGFTAYLVTLALLLAATYTGLFRPAIVYDYFGYIISSLNVLAWTLCATLVVKGHIAPSTTDSGSNGNWIQDFYWGMELYPNILGWDVKMLTNCRCGMMFWAVGILCFAHKQMELNDGQLSLAMAVNVCLQLVYVCKFFHWEMGYMCSMDIQHDRAGYYLCWGCLVWVPSVYTSHSLYLVEHAPLDMSVFTAALLFGCGLFMIFLNYDSDQQRYVFRQTKAQCILWGRCPPEHIVAEYTTTDGSRKMSLLLVDGWWQFSRHFHYIPEILASLFWSLPALDTGLVGPYFYVIYLTILLTDRAYRDDARCQRKYGPYWEEYCDKVPFKIVPGVI